MKKVGIFIPQNYVKYIKSSTPIGIFLKRGTEALL